MNEGDIDHIDADRLDDKTNQAGSFDFEQTVSYGDDDDALAIAHLAKRLGQAKSMKSLSSAEITEKAEDMYAAICQQIASGVSDEQLEKMADLLGENSLTLKLRLQG